MLSFIWLFDGILTLFLVEIDEDDQTKDSKIEENQTKDSNKDEIQTKDSGVTYKDESQHEQTSSKISETETDIAPIDVIVVKEPIGVDSKCVKNPFAVPVFKTPACICMMVYGFFHFGGMMGTIIFLPPLLTESLLPANDSDSDAMVAGQADVTTALATFGGGGIAGNIMFGLIMTFGPLANKRFALFVANNVVMLTVAGKYDD